LKSRYIAYTILQQLLAGLTEWYNTEQFALPDEKWHLTEDYERVRNYVLHNETSSPCRQLLLPDIICDVPVRAVSEFTPRYDPASTSIRSIIKEGVYVPQPKPNLYDPPDVYIPAFDAPDGEIDILSIIENGVQFVPNKARVKALAGDLDPLRHRQLAAGRKPITSNLEPGQGWDLMTKSAADNCDGSWDAFCGRSADSRCLLYAHNDNRGGLKFDSLSGWLIVNLEKVKHGIAFVRMENWIGPNQVATTAGWKCENGKTDCPAAKADDGKRRQLREEQEQQRQLKGTNPNIFCADWRFEFAIDGKITSWDLDAFNNQVYSAQRVVQLSVLLNDPDYTGGQEKDVELAIRMTGCARDVTFSLSHIYWL